MSRKDELVRRIKNLAVTPSDYENGTELLKLMAHFGVNGLRDLSVEQLEHYLEIVICDKEEHKYG